MCVVGCLSTSKLGTLCTRPRQSICSVVRDNTVLPTRALKTSKHRNDINTPASVFDVLIVRCLCSRQRTAENFESVFIRIRWKLWDLLIIIFRLVSDILCAINWTYDDMEYSFMYLLAGRETRKKILLLMVSFSIFAQKFMIRHSCYSKFMIPSWTWSISKVYSLLSSAFIQWKLTNKPYW